QPLRSGVVRPGAGRARAESSGDLAHHFPCERVAQGFVAQRRRDRRGVVGGVGGRDHAEGECKQDAGERRVEVFHGSILSVLTASGRAGSMRSSRESGVQLTDQGELAALLRCPRCKQGRLSLQRAGWICGSCSSGYPVIGELPWLFADPQATLAEWRARLHYLVLELEREA